jgi:hypothetical protein
MPIMHDPRNRIPILRPCQRCGGLVTRSDSRSASVHRLKKETLCARARCAAVIARRSRPIRFVIMATSVTLAALGICLGILRMLLGSLSPEALVVGLIVVMPPYLWALDRRFLIWSYVR